jgi:hypothetical protein
MNKYIKVTEKDKSPVIVLASNEGFYKSRGAKIEEATKKEIEQFFPEETKKGNSEESKKSLEAANADLEAEKSAHADTKKSLEAANADLDSARKEVEKLTKKQ